MHIFRASLLSLFFVGSMTSLNVSAAAAAVVKEVGSNVGIMTALMDSPKKTAIRAAILGSVFYVANAESKTTEELNALKAGNLRQKARFVERSLFQLATDAQDAKPIVKNGQLVGLTDSKEACSAGYIMLVPQKALKITNPVYNLLKGPMIMLAGAKFVAPESSLKDLINASYTWLKTGLASIPTAL